MRSHLVNKSAIDQGTFESKKNDQKNAQENTFNNMEDDQNDNEL